MDNTPTVREDLARALAKLLIRMGLVTAEEMMDAADRAANQTERGETVAHLMRVAIMEAHDAGGPPISPSERKAQF